MEYPPSVSLARSHAYLGAYSSPAGHRMPESNKPPIPPAVYIHTGRASSSVIQTETRFRKRASYDINLLPVRQGTHANASVPIEYVPAQHRHASEDRHEPLGLAVLHQLPSAAKIPFSNVPSLITPQISQAPYTSRCLHIFSSRILLHITHRD